MKLDTLLSFFISSLILALAPGPDNMYVLALSIARGAKSAIVLSTGLMTGVIVHTLVCALGISLLIINSPNALLFVKILGACYLAYLALQTLKEDSEKNAAKSTEIKTSKKEMKRLYLRGFSMNVLNPKVMLFFLAFLPQFTSKDAEFSICFQIVILGLIFMLSVLIVMFSIALLGAKLKPILAKGVFWKIEKYLRFAIFTSIAIAIIFC